MTDIEGSREAFWSTFYAERKRGGHFMPPSQFAAFMSQEIPDHATLFDIGCGNGRDSLFFASIGFTTLGIDASEAAISFATEYAAQHNVNNLKFICAHSGSETLAEALRHRTAAPVCVYARFFLHAITAEEQSALFEMLSQTLRNGDVVAFEYRTWEDAALEKEALPHFRRYQASTDVDHALAENGFAKVYGVEGNGFAKFKSEDAIVARGVYRRER